MRILRSKEASEIWRPTHHKGSLSTDLVHLQAKPVLFVDIDGVVSLRRIASADRPGGAFHNVDGVMHFLSADAGIHLLALRDRFELVSSLPHALALPRELPFLSFDRNPGREHGRSKLDAIAPH